MRLAIILILGFNVLLIGAMLVLYGLKRRHERIVADLDDFCADLPPDFDRADPYVLVNRTWVRCTPPCETSPQLK